MHLRSAALAAVLLTASLPAFAAVIVVDAMSLELPVNPCFPVTNPRVVAWGDYCDAPSCPPGIPIPTGYSCYYVGELGLTTGLGESARNVAVNGGGASHRMHDDGR